MSSRPPWAAEYNVVSNETKETKTATVNYQTSKPRTPENWYQ